jgi:hypothetical protein
MKWQKINWLLADDTNACAPKYLLVARQAYGAQAYFSAYEDNFGNP